MPERGPIFLVIGSFLAILGAAMFICMLADLAYRNPDWQIFATAGIITVLIGLGLAATVDRRSPSLTLRQAILMTVGAWVILPVFAALPFYWAGFAPSYVDAYFEAVSGITTTGATVLTGLDTMPPGILLWRSLLQWMGGLGVIVMAVAVMPMLRIGGMQLFKAEAFDTSDKILPRATQISGTLTAVFTILTLTCALFYMLAGMGSFDAICHAMSTVATGGFSTKDASIGAFQSETIDVIASVFMLLGSLPFLLYIKFMQGKPEGLYSDSQVRTFLGLILFFTVMMWMYQEMQNVRGESDALVFAFFNVTSIMTGTGFATDDYNAWGPFAATVFFCITFLGGCSGSTSCGIKTFRLEVAFATVMQHLKRATMPHGVFIMRYNGRLLPDSVVAAVMSFIFLYIASFAVLSALLMLTGLDGMTAISGAATAISNVGPGLGDIIGPAGNFSTLNDAAKWLLCFGMILGRLEIFTVLVVFVPQFWTR
jgi:trk system potassium uptake protein TrkH